jgi:general secretion pathway protein H
LEGAPVKLIPLRTGSKGFTLLEILIVLIVFSLSIALISPSLVSGVNRLGLKTTTRKMASTLDHARNQALRERKVYYAHALGDRLVIKTPETKRPVREMAVSDHTEVTTNSGAAIAFYPGGGSSGGILEVRDLNNESFYRIKVTPSTSRVIISTLLK